MVIIDAALSAYASVIILGAARYAARYLMPCRYMRRPYATACLRHGYLCRAATLNILLYFCGLPPTRRHCLKIRADAITLIYVMRLLYHVCRSLLGEYEDGRLHRLSNSLIGHAVNIAPSAYAAYGHRFRPTLPATSCLMPRPHLARLRVYKMPLLIKTSAMHYYDYDICVYHICRAPRYMHAFIERRHTSF